MIGPRNDERAVSISVTHVLTLGITTVLISMLLIGGSSVLEAETDRSVESSLETVGERLAGEIENVDQIGEDETTLTAEHPRTVSNTAYTVTLLDSDSCADAPLLDGSIDCLRLSAQDVDVVVHVPVAIDSQLENEISAPGGTIEISYVDDSPEDKIRIQEEN